VVPAFHILPLNNLMKEFVKSPLLESSITFEAREIPPGGYCRF
jgi:hypothetical protein